MLLDVCNFVLDTDGFVVALALALEPDPIAIAIAIAIDFPIGHQIARKQIGGDLILHKEFHQVFGEFNLLGQGTLGQSQELFELRLDLNDAHTQDRRVELHRSEGLGKSLLFRRERPDCVFEFFCRWNLVEEQGDVDLVLVSENDCVLWLHAIPTRHGSDQEHKRRKLPCPSIQSNGF